MTPEVPVPGDAQILSTYLGISPRTPESAVLRLLVELGVTSVGADEGSLLVLDPDRKELVFVMTIGASEEMLRGQRIPVGKGITGLAAATADVQVGAPTFEDREQTARASQPVTVLAAPMLVREEVVGVITAAAFRPEKRFGQADAALYGKIAAIASVVAEQSRRLATIEALGREGEAALGADGISGEEVAIATAVTRLTRAHPERLAAVRALLTAVSELAT